MTDYKEIRMKDDMVYKAGLTCTKKELAGMYSLALKREQELEKDNARLRDFIKEMISYVGVPYWEEKANELLKEKGKKE
jgi:hypothetical protein